MIIASHQPAFLPWPGFWHKFIHCDKFVLSCGVQWAKDGFLNRIRHDGGWLTLPVSASDTDPIMDVMVTKDVGRVAKVQKAFAQAQASTRRYPHASRLAFLTEISMQPGMTLIQINLQLIHAIAEQLCPQVEIVVDCTPPDLEKGETKTDRLLGRLDRCAPGWSQYLMGRGATAYYEPEKWPHPVLVQDARGFDPEFSIIDLLGKVEDPVEWLLERGRFRTVMEDKDAIAGAASGGDRSAH